MIFFYQLKEKPKQYWPNMVNATVNQGTFAIQLKSEKTYSHFTVRLFLLTNKKVWIQTDGGSIFAYSNVFSLLSQNVVFFLNYFFQFKSQEKTARQCNFSSLRGQMVEHHILLISLCIIDIWQERWRNIPRINSSFIAGNQHLIKISDGIFLMYLHVLFVCQMERYIVLRIKNNPPPTPTHTPALKDRFSGFGKRIFSQGHL